MSCVRNNPNLLTFKYVCVCLKKELFWNGKLMFMYGKICCLVYFVGVEIDDVRRPQLKGNLKLCKLYETHEFFFELNNKIAKLLMSVSKKLI
jgi:hypothetical protein